MEWLFKLVSHAHLIATFMLVLARTSGMLMSAPVMSGVEVPMQVRALLALALAALSTPLQPELTPIGDVSIFDFMLLTLSEMLVGIMLGLGITILLASFQLAGYMIGQLGGMSLAEVLNPSLDSNVPLVSQILNMLALAIFVLLGGHRMLLVGLLETFDAIPPGSAAFTESLSDLLSNLMAQSFALGVRTAAPSAAALLLATFAMGVLSRTLPQLNLMSLGFGVNALATLGTLWVSFGSVAYLLDEHIEPTVQAVLEALALG